ncbi:MAG: biopolymer transporter ExbD [Syntrophales bacterium]
MEEKEFDYINVIPFVDIMLVLLTIVLTTSTFIATGMISVSLPKASPAHSGVLQRHTISIDRCGAIYFDAARVSLGELSSKVGGIDRNTPLTVRADRTIALQIFVDVLDILNARGFKKVAVQTERKR